MTPADPTATRTRFRQVVQRGRERADREWREHLASLAPRQRTAAEIREAQVVQFRPRRKSPRAGRAVTRQ